MRALPAPRLMETDNSFQSRVSEADSKPLRVSVAVPLHNEEAVIPELLSRLDKILNAIEGGPHEIVMVDDGSTDRTAAMLEDAARLDPRLVVIVFSRNFGHQAALTAALDHVSGDVVILMDADLQDRPEAIPVFLEKYRNGYDVVYARRMNRKEPIWLRASYKLFYRLLGTISDMQIPMDAGDFGLVSRRVVLELRQLREHHRYLRGLRSWVGFRQIGIEVERDARFAGKAKYGIRRLFKLAFDGIFSFSILPIRAAGLFGILALAVSSAYALYTLYAKLVLHVSPQGFTAIIILVTFLSGVQLTFLGVIGEYLGRVYEEAKTRPAYIVDRLTRGGQSPEMKTTD
jgi:glycosyltransferase involved in cell wall biosynthesis